MTTFLHTHSWLNWVDVKYESYPPNKYSGTDIIRMVEFLIDNFYVEFGGHVYQQTVGITMGTLISLFAMYMMLYHLINNPKVNYYIDVIYPEQLEIKDTTYAVLTVVWILMRILNITHNAKHKRDVPLPP